MKRLSDSTGAPGRCFGALVAMGALYGDSYIQWIHHI